MQVALLCQLTKYVLFNKLTVVLATSQVHRVINNKTKRVSSYSFIA